MAAPIRVLVVDDSALMRRVISEMLSREPGITVVGTAADGLQATERCRALDPDVVTLDVEMPRCDGLEGLRLIMAERPRPVVMVSSLTREGAEVTLRALEAGAVDFVAKPGGPISLDMAAVAAELVRKVRAAARARPRVMLQRVERRLDVLQRPAAAPAPARLSRPGGGGPEGMMVIGASTGGPAALLELVPRLAADLPPTVIVQHMPAGFTRSLAERLADASALEVREGRDGEPLQPGVALVAPGDLHACVDERGRLRLEASAPRHGVRPSVDVLLESLLGLEPFPRLLGVILTGMGVDGARGLLAARSRGATVLAQDEASCVVYGMPRAAVELGAAHHVVPLEAMPEMIMRQVAGWGSWVGAFHSTGRRGG